MFIDMLRSACCSCRQVTKFHVILGVMDVGFGVSCKNPLLRDHCNERDFIYQRSNSPLLHHSDVIQSELSRKELHEVQCRVRK